jgi:hypothetical protein
VWRSRWLLWAGIHSQDSRGGILNDWISEQIEVPRLDYRTWALPPLTHMVSGTDSAYAGSDPSSHPEVGRTGNDLSWGCQSIVCEI